MRITQPWNKHLTKLYLKCPLHLKYVLAVPWEIWSDTLSRQRNRYLLLFYLFIRHVHFSESLNSHKHDWQLLSQNRQTCSKSYHLYTIYSKCPSPARMQLRRLWRTRHTLRSIIAWFRSAHLFFMPRLSPSTSEIFGTRWRWTFRVYDIKMM